MVRMSKEALRIYNAQSLKMGRPLINDDSNDIDTFQQETEEVTPYITGLQTTVDDPDYAKNIKQELDWISNSTHYLFDAVDAAKDAYTQAQQAASDATGAYNAAQDAQTAANQAAKDALDALTAAEKADATAIQNAKDIVTINDDLTGITEDVSDANASASEALSVAQGVDDEYSAQWGIQTDVNDLKGGVGFYNDGTTTYFVIAADVFAVFNGDTIVMESKDGVVYCYAPVDFGKVDSPYGMYTFSGTGGFTVSGFPDSTPWSLQLTSGFFAYPSGGDYDLQVNGVSYKDWLYHAGEYTVPHGTINAGDSLHITYKNLVSNVSFSSGFILTNQIT